MVQWLRLHVPNAGARVQSLVRALDATAKTRHSQIQERQRERKEERKKENPNGGLQARNGGGSHQHQPWRGEKTQIPDMFGVKLC